jgi:hypothetical protein
MHQPKKYKIKTPSVIKEGESMAKLALGTGTQGIDPVKPLYVKSKKDPRYIAYQDSLILHNATKGIVNELKGTKTIQDWVKFSKDWGDKHTSTALPAATRLAKLNKVQPQPIKSLEKFNKAGYAGEFKKPTRLVEIQSEDSSQLKKNDYWNTDPDVLAFRKKFVEQFGEEPSRDPNVAMYDYDKAYRSGARPVLDDEDGLYHWSSNFKHDEHPNRFVDGIDTRSGRQQAVSLENHLSPMGMTQPESEPLTIRPEARKAKYFNITDKVNQNFGGSETSYRWTPGQEDLREQSQEIYPDGTPYNSRTIKPVYELGTNKDGIMKNKKITPRNKYANGTTSNGVGPNNYIPSPAETLADYQIMVDKAEGHAMNNGWLKGLAIAAPIVQAGFGAAKGFLPQKQMGDSNVQEQMIEAEGGEVMEDPQTGEVQELQGPSHAEGGIPMEVGQQPGQVKPGTVIYSEQLKGEDGKTMAERKKIRTAQEEKLDKLISEKKGDIAVKNAIMRRKTALAQQDEQDLKTQEFAQMEQQMQQQMEQAMMASQMGMEQGMEGGEEGMPEEVMMAMGEEGEEIEEFAYGGEVEGEPVYSIVGESMPSPLTNKMSPIGDINNEPVFTGRTAPRKDEYGNPIPSAQIRETQTQLNMERLANTEGRARSLWLYNNPGKTWGDYSRAVESRNNMPDVPLEGLLIDQAIIGTKPKGSCSEMGQNIPLDQKGGGSLKTIKALGTGPEGLINEDYMYNFGGMVPSFEEDLENPDPIARPQLSSIGNIGTPMSFTPAKIPSTSPKQMVASMEAEVEMLDRNNSSPNKLENILSKIGYLPTAGDVTGLVGNAYSAISPMKNTLQNRAGDKLHENYYRNFGKDALQATEDSKEFIAGQKDTSLRRLQANAAGSKRAGRNGARGINQMRMSDYMADMAGNQGASDIQSQYAVQMMQILAGQAGLENAQDHAVMKGEADARTADEMARDNFYTQYGKDKATFGQGLQQTGKDLNQMAMNPMILNLMKEMGKYVTVGRDGKLVAKNQ